MPISGLNDRGIPGHQTARKNFTTETASGCSFLQPPDVLVSDVGDVVCNLETWNHECKTLTEYCHRFTCPGIMKRKKSETDGFLKRAMPKVSSQTLESEATRSPLRQHRLTIVEYQLRNLRGCSSIAFGNQTVLVTPLQNRIRVQKTHGFASLPHNRFAFIGTIVRSFERTNTLGVPLY